LRKEILLDREVGELNLGIFEVVKFVRKCDHEVRKVSEYCFGREKPAVWIERYIVFRIQYAYFRQLL
jgi:hypothetical protein